MYTSISSGLCLWFFTKQSNCLFSLPMHGQVKSWSLKRISEFGYFRAHATRTDLNLEVSIYILTQLYSNLSCRHRKTSEKMTSLFSTPSIYICFYDAIHWLRISQCNCFFDESSPPHKDNKETKKHKTERGISFKQQISKNNRTKWLFTSSLNFPSSNFSLLWFVKHTNVNKVPWYYSC